MQKFPKPWRSERVPDGYAVRDAEGKIVAHIHGWDGPGNSHNVLAPLTMAEAREMSQRIAELAKTREQADATPPQHGNTETLQFKPR